MRRLIAGVLFAAAFGVPSSWGGAVWMEDMSSVTEWGCWQSSFAGSYRGVAVQQENGPATLGKSWIGLGLRDVSVCRYLHVKALKCVGGCARVAVSGPSDANYTEYMTFTNIGEACVDISSWPGNVAGNEDVYIQLIVDGENASVTWDYAALWDTLPICPPPGVLPPQEEAIDPYLATPAENAMYEIPVLAIAYYATTNGTNLDPVETGRSDSIADMKAWVVRNARTTKFMLEEGSRYRGYRYARGQDSRLPPPSLGYRIVKWISVYERLPRNYQHSPLRPDYFQMVSRFGLENLVNSCGVKEVWVWSQHYGDVAPDESNMSSPTTPDISNSYRWSDDLPVFNSTYVLYNYNYGCGANENVEDHLHQLEAILRYRDWNMFDYVFCPYSRSGNCHKPPNTTADYDWYNSTVVASDIEDWRPDRATPISLGQPGVTNVNALTWHSIPYPYPSQSISTNKWFVYWMQTHPGRFNFIPYRTNNYVMANWWHLTGDWDESIQQGRYLYRSRPMFVDLEMATSKRTTLLGTEITFTLDIMNLGTNTAAGVTVTNALPVGLTFLSATSSVGTCSHAGSVVSCQIGDMVTGAYASVSIRAFPTTSGTHSNQANVYFDWNGLPVTMSARAGDRVPLDGDCDRMGDEWEWACFQSLTNGTAEDSDSDGFSNYAEWRAGTDAAQASSCFTASAVRADSGTGHVIRWPSATNRTYRVSRSTNLAFQFMEIASGIPASPPVNSYTDYVAEAGPFYYRPSVEE